MRFGLILLAFITGNSSLEPLLEGLFAQIHIDVSWRGFGRNRTGDLRTIQICSVPRSSPLSYGDGCITEDPLWPSFLGYVIQANVKFKEKCDLSLIVSKLHFKNVYINHVQNWQHITKLPLST